MRTRVTVVFLAMCLGALSVLVGCGSKSIETKDYSLGTFTVKVPIEFTVNEAKDNLVVTDANQSFSMDISIYDMEILGTTFEDNQAFCKDFYQDTYKELSIAGMDGYMYNAGMGILVYTKIDDQNYLCIHFLSEGNADAALDKKFNDHKIQTIIEGISK